MSIGDIVWPYGEAAPGGRMGSCTRRASEISHPFDYAQGRLSRKNKNTARAHTNRLAIQIKNSVKWVITLVLAAMTAVSGVSQETRKIEQGTAATDAVRAAARRANLPPRVIQAERFLAERGWTRGGLAAWAGAGAFRRSAQAVAAEPDAHADSQGSGTATWQPLGPTAVQSQDFGLVTGRVSALALDPSDATGNTLYVGTTGGGVWKSQNADTSNTANISFIPLTDEAAGMGGAAGTSISIGALSVQPGGMGVILAGTGDPNDSLDSYYGAGILRSTNGGTTWSLISTTADQHYSFVGEGIAGFAWSTTNPQLVVMAVSQAYEGTLVNVSWPGQSYEGLYYSSDSGATWSLARITDGASGDVQGPSTSDPFIQPDGNAATAVVWNPVRQLFVAAVRFHGYYQSADGITWTRIVNQPYAALMTSAGLCPTTNSGYTGSIGCPIFRGALAVNPQTGDTFAWTVDYYNQDQGIWQDLCAANAGSCASQTFTFAQQWQTQTSPATLETSTLQGPATIENGDYNLTLAAVPSGQTTIVLAGANDLWKTNCPYSQGCRWRNTTNSTTCMSAQVGEYQHALEWNENNPLEILVGNDSGLWRSTDAIDETETVCSASDATHFQNLNGSLGSLAEVVSMSQAGSTPYTMMAGLGVNGTAGVESTTGMTAEWPEILGGEGGPVAIDPTNSNNWYVNNQAGVSIYLCSQATPCTPTAFGTTPVVTDADVGGDGLSMSVPAPFLVDPLDDTKLLIGTCRVWRGPASGASWSSSDAISPIFDNLASSGPCSGDALIRSMSAAALPSGGEVVYAGMYGSANGGAALPGHVLSSTFNTATGTWSAWTDVTALNAVTNDTHTMNYYGFDISSIFIDPHDTSGQTVYATVAGISALSEIVQTVYRSLDGGAHWTALTANLPLTPANSLVVDPLDANTVYIATDAGVYSTRQISSCAIATFECWSAFGSGLPEAPVVELSAAPATASVPDLVAATYGRGIWVNPLWTATETLTTATVTLSTLTFASQMYGTSSTRTVTVENTGTSALTPGAITVSGDFSETDNCQGETVAPGATCAIQVTFTPTQTGSRTGVLTINANVAGGALTVSLIGSGAPAGVMSLNPPTIQFGGWQVETTSTALQVTATNSGFTPISYTSGLTGPFTIASNACGNLVAANSSCNLTLTFTPAQAGAATGTLTFTDIAGTQSVALSGTGLAAPTDALSPTSLTFPATIEGQLSAAQTLTLTNSGGVPLTYINISVSGAFQQTNNCTASLAANSSCAISVQFDPTATGTQTGTLSISDVTRTQPQTVALSGTGLAPPVLSVSPTILSFTGQSVGQASAAQTVTVSNTGGAPLANVGFQIIGLSASSFSYGASTCGATLAIGNSCTVQVTFTPTASGGALASLAVSSSTPGVAPVTVTLSGNGLMPAWLNVSATQLVFPIVMPGQQSPALPVTLTNTGSLVITSLTLTATVPFSLVQNTCGASLAAGASCSTGVVFSPLLSGPYTGALTITTLSPAATIVILLSGTGGTPGSVQAQPSFVNFATQSGSSETGVGLLSSPVTVTLTNPDNVNSLNSVTVAVTAGFKLVSTTCTSTLAAEASCAAVVEFAPVSAGAQSGSLIVTSSALPTGSIVPLSGMGFDFSITPSGSSTQTITNGQTADYTLVIMPLQGSQGVFSFQCSALPPNSACTFNPVSMSVPANTTGNVLVEIATGITTTTAKSAPPLTWPALPLACGLALIPFARMRRRKALLLITLLVIFAGGISSCTSSGVISGGTGTGSGSGTDITSPGTFSVVVTATSNGVPHQVTLTLVVD